ARMFCRSSRLSLALPMCCQELTKARAGRSPAELPQHHHDLAAVVRRMIQGVLNQLAKDVFVFIDGACRPELLVAQLSHEDVLFFLEGVPDVHDLRQIGKLGRSEVGSEVVVAPVPKPRTLTPEQVTQRPLDRLKAASKVPVELFR